MRTVIAVIYVVIAMGCTRDRATIVVGQPIATINQLIGDTSFQVAHGRPPTRDDDPTDRVRTHLAYVEAQLRVRDVGHLAIAQQRARGRVLDDLHRYWTAGEFPASDAVTGLLPTFIDDRGVRCAVAYLAEQGVGAEVVETMNRRYRNAYIAQIDERQLDDWAVASGVTRDELELIQPAYPPETPDVDLKLGADYRHAFARDATMAPLTHVATLQGGLRWNQKHNRWIGAPVLGLDGGVGWADGSQLVYNAHVRLGTQVRMYLGNGNGHHIGALGGFGLDQIGDRISRAWTVPVDGFWYVRPKNTMRLGLIGGPRFTVAGAARGLGWRAGLEFVRRSLSESSSPVAPRDVHLMLAVERIADATFVGVSFAVGARGNHGFYNQW